MTGNRRALFFSSLALLVAGAGAAYYFKVGPGLLSSESPMATPEAAPEVIPESGDSSKPNTLGANMNSTNTTSEADGLSQAVATMTLEKGGTIKWRFYTKDAPNTTKRIMQLISEGFYNGIVFHRVVPGFVVQAGDPTGTGTSGSGVKLKQEFNHHKHVKGIVSMARTQDPDSADSQFFMMLGTAESLDRQYTVIGKVVEGVELLDGIRQGDKIQSFSLSN